MPKIEQIHTTFENLEQLRDPLTAQGLARMMVVSTEDYVSQQSMTTEQANTLVGVFEEVGTLLTERLEALEAQGFNHEQMIGAVMSFAHGLQVDVADTMYEELSPLLRMAWLAQQQRIMSHHTLFGSLFQAHQQGIGDFREDGKNVWHALYDAPAPFKLCMPGLLAAAAKHKAAMNKPEPAPDTEGPNADDIVGAVDALRRFVPKIKDPALRAKLEATIALGESITSGMSTDDSDGADEMEYSEVIELTGDYTPEEVALTIQAQIKAATGRELPLDQLLASIRQAETNGFAVATFQKEN